MNVRLHQKLSRSFLIIILSATLLCGTTVGATKPAPADIQLALLLDTSNSMDGLINQAKSQLWKIVNEMARAQRGGRLVSLDVALFEYGNSGLSAAEGYIRMIVPLTNDLDKISEELFSLKTNGGDEYCGMVIKEAVDRLAWSSNNQDLKVIVIAGNEPFTQGGTDYRKSTKHAIERGIIVNTIFCGPFDEGVQTKWKDGADLADGSYINIDQNQQIQHIPAPQDDEINRLSEELNATYIAYGQSGRERKKMQSQQDANAASLGEGIAAERAVAKASTNYQNTSWDLVDATNTKTVDVEEMKDDDLPAEMKGMSDKEKKDYIDTKAKKREELQKQIQTLNDERRKFIADQAKKSSGNTLDAAIIKAIRDQASSRNYTFAD